MEKKILLLDPDLNIFTALTVTERDGKLYAQEEGHPEFQILPEVADPDEQQELAKMYLMQVSDTGEDYLGRVPGATSKNLEEVKELAKQMLSSG